MPDLHRKGSYGFGSFPTTGRGGSGSSHRTQPTFTERTPLLSPTSPNPNPNLPTPHLTRTSSPKALSPAPTSDSSATYPKTNTPQRRPSRIPAGPKGTSTFAQTLVGTVSVMVGINLVSMPFAISKAGWVMGACLMIGWGLVQRRTYVYQEFCIFIFISSSRSDHPSCSVQRKTFSGYHSE